MLALYSLGSLLEIRRGSIRYGALVLVTAVISNYCQYWIPNHMLSSPTQIDAFGGMSGVIFGIFGYLWIKTRFDPTAGIFLPSQTISMALIWLVLCFTGIFGSVANWAHLGGLVTGCAIAYSPVAWRKLT
jgi:GlpG protein